MIVALAFALVVFLEAARRQRKEALVLKYQYRLFALRDQLREHAMQHPPDAQTWIFQYLDSTIAKSIGLLPRMSIWYLLALVLTYRDDLELQKLRAELEKQWSNPENRKYKEIEERLTEALGEFVVTRHIVMIVISAAAVVLPVDLVQFLHEMKRRSLELVLESPETSTLYKFAPSAG